MQEIVDKTKNEIEQFLKNSMEHEDKEIDCILVKPDTKETITLASDGMERMIMFAPYTTKENRYDKGYMEVKEWDFSFDGYIFEELEKGYRIGTISDRMNYGIWQEIDEFYPEDIENKNGLQIYLKYCVDNKITKEYLDKNLNLNTKDIIKFYKGLEFGTIVEHKGYVAFVDDYNLDNDMENIVYIYKNKDDYIKKESIESVSLNSIELEQNIKDYIDRTYLKNEKDNMTIPQKESEINYIAFCLGYDLLNEKLRETTNNECDKVYDFCNYLANKFIETSYYNDMNYSTYDNLRKWLEDNKDIIQSEYLSYFDIDNKCILEVGKRRDVPVALVEQTTKYGKEYCVAFGYEVNDEKVKWGYAYYYNENFEKAKRDFEYVKAGGNLADTFDEKQSKKHKENER